MLFWPKIVFSENVCTAPFSWRPKFCYQLVLVNKNNVFSSLNAHVHPPPAAAHCSSRKGKRKVGRCPSFCVLGTSLSAVFLEGLIPPCVNAKCCNSETQAQSWAWVHHYCESTAWRKRCESFLGWQLQSSEASLALNRAGNLEKATKSQARHWSASAESLGCGRTHFSLSPRKSEEEGEIKG